MTIKEIVEKYWQDFEVIAFQAVKNTLPQNLIIHEKLTQAIKDGGYDGEFVLLSEGNSLLQIIFEAKLRSDTKADLPLKDFAKALVIAIVRQADRIYIVTNLHFSQGTLSILESYANSVPLEIQLINGYSVKEFMESNENALENIHVELRDFLLTQEDVLCAQTIPPRTFSRDAPATVWNEVGLTELTRDYSNHAEIFAREKGRLLVTGKVGCGKSHYIENLAHVLNCHGKTVCLIDLSKCLTYKELFLEIMSKTMGLSLELVDLMNEEAFADAFSKIGTSTANGDDIQMLRFLFAREDEYPYDYSILFSQIVNFYYKIFSISQKKNTVIIAFLNLVYAQKEVLELLLYFLKSENAFSCILEVANDDFWENDLKNWATIKQNLIRTSTFQPYTVKDWDIGESTRFLQQHIEGLSREQLDLLVQKFGQTPSELSNLIELINYSNLYNNVPRELVFREIFDLKITKNDNLYYKCLEYMQFANSDILYLYAFVFLLCGEVSLDFLSQYFSDVYRFEKCVSIVGRSNLFRVNGRKISVKNAKIEECLQQYCEDRLHFFSIQPVANFIKAHRDCIHISLEKQIELKCKLDYYKNSETYVLSLTTLGDKYLKLGQLALAEAKYRKARNVEEEEKLTSLSPLVKIRIYLGLVEVLIWKIGIAGDEIEECLRITRNLATETDCQSQEYRLLILRYYLLSYQFYHTQNLRKSALEYAQMGVQWIEKNNLYDSDIEACGKMWRFYAIAVKEDTQDIKKCLSIFEQGVKKCQLSAKFLFGYIIHQNMDVIGGTSQERARIKLENYKLLAKQDKKLSVDEYLHYKTNVAALHFLLKEYDTAWEEYEKLLEKSSIFNITREEIRILNDMANICWIRDDLVEARKKYYTAKRLGKISGCAGNYWPVLINLMSFEVFCKDSAAAWNLHECLCPYLQQICTDFTAENLSYERREYCEAVLKIHLKNLWKLYQAEPNNDSVAKIISLWKKTPFSSGDFCQKEILGEKICQLELNGTIFDHNGLYLVKD